VAALGPIGHPGGLPAVIDALEDKPTVRRRATVALAGFDDPRVEPALRRASGDRDWQVRQAADELMEDADGPA
jgi:HEAT repeat protein